MARYNYDLLLEALDKAENGPIIDENEWDQEVIGKNAREILQKFDITLNKNNPYVTDDDRLADRLWEAGMEMAVRSGVYCVDTKRQMLWTRNELDTIVESLPGEATVGTGDDTVTITHRRPEDPRHVVIFGGSFGIPCSEEMFIPFHEAYAREPHIEILSLGTLLSTHGRPIRAGSPWEVVAGWQEKELAFEILERAGRPGMAVGCVEIATTDVGELAGTTYGGYRPTDVHKINFMSEQKTAYHHLTKAAHYAHVDAVSESFFNPMFGGFFGGAPGIALACVAGSLVMRACYQGTLNNFGPTHLHISNCTHPEVLRAVQLAQQSLARNSHFLTSPFVRPSNGPGTMEIFYECGALAVASTASGCSVIDASQSAVGIHETHASPLEVIFVSKVTHAVEGMSRADAAPIVDWMIDRYKDRQKDASIGKPFTELHDLETLEAKPEWNGMYEKAIEEVKQQFGLDISA